MAFSPPRGGRGTNPFDDDSDSDNDSQSYSYSYDSTVDNDMMEEGAGTGGDSYDDKHNSNHNSNNNKINKTNPTAPSSKNGQHLNEAGAGPAEASWQFLGDLPYRRVSLYDVHSNTLAWGHTRSPAAGTEDSTSTSISVSVIKSKKDKRQRDRHGLACLPPQAQTNIKSSHLTPAEYEQFLASTTHTLIASCPNGGPIATITVPLSLSTPVSTTNNNNNNNNTIQSALNETQIRIMTNAGQILSTIDFPPPNGIRIPNSTSSNSNASSKRTTHYTASDVLNIGFTSRCILILILRDSLCLTYSLSGKPILPPFHILQDAAKHAAKHTNSHSHSHSHSHSNSSGAYELMEANVYDGGVAVLSASMSCALVELLDGREEGEENYRLGAHGAARTVRALDWEQEQGIGGGAGAGTVGITGAGIGAGIGTGIGENESDSHSHSHSYSKDGVHPIMDEHTSTYYALVTPLATATHAKANYVSYTSIAVLPRIHTPMRHPEVFLGTTSNSVIICDASARGGIVDVNCQERIRSPIVQMKFAPNGRFLACFTEGSIMTVISTNFETKVLDFDTSDGSSDLPHNMEWCGEDSVVLHWKNLGVLMVGPYGDWLRFPYDGVQNVHLCAEMDCCRVITDKGVEILQRVPPATANMLRIGSIEPAAMLLDASDAFQSGSPASDEAARAITRTGLLMDAIEVCVDAATKEFDVAMQKRLLRAASYGMHFDYKDGSARGVMGGKTNGYEEHNTRPSEVAMMFVEAAKKVRVMNALRDPAVGFVLTVAQFDSIEAHGVIARLIAIKRPALATYLGTYLQLDESVRAYARAARAAAYVATDTSKSDSNTTDAAIKILNTDVKSQLMNRGAYATVALAANNAGRQGVANLLLTLETSVADKVPGLTAIGLYSDAAAVAVNAKDDDLIFHVLAEFEKACISKTRDAAQAQLFYLSTIVQKFPPEAMNLLSKYFSSMQDVKHVINLKNKGRDYAASGKVIAQRALNLPREQDRLSALQEASRVFAQGKDTLFLKASTDEYLELILEQERLRRIYGPDVTTKTSSVTDTIFNILCYAAVKLRDANKLLAESEKLAKKFKVPEKRLWHTKIRAFAATDQWNSLRYMAESRTKVPISFKYFALAAIQKQRDISDILFYIQKVTDGEERYDLFCEAKLWKRALDEAKKLDDVRRVLNVRAVCNDPDIQRLCDQFASNYS